MSIDAVEGDVKPRLFKKVVDVSIQMYPNYLIPIGIHPLSWTFDSNDLPVRPAQVSAMCLASLVQAWVLSGRSIWRWVPRLLRIQSYSHTVSSMVFDGVCVCWRMFFLMFPTFCQPFVVCCTMISYYKGFFFAMWSNRISVLECALVLCFVEPPSWRDSIGKMSLSTGLWDMNNH